MLYTQREALLVVLRYLLVLGRPLQVRSPAEVSNQVDAGKRATIHFGEIWLQVWIMDLWGAKDWMQR
jgi:hypothetical protein